MFSWGRGKDGCLGLGSISDKELPTLLVKSIYDYDIQQLSGGKEHVLMLLAKGKVCVWG